MSVPARLQKIRRIVWTGAIASVTATGAWYGAGLRIQSDVKTVKPLHLNPRLAWRGASSIILHLI